MFHGSTSDEATMGAYQRMRQPRISEAGKRQLRLLVVGGSEEDFASLRELLAEAGNGTLRLEHAASPEDVLNQLGKGQPGDARAVNKGVIPDHTPPEGYRQPRHLGTNIAQPNHPEKAPLWQGIIKIK